MPKRRGKLIVIEGTDGSGKTEQFKRLVRRLKKEHRRVATVDFPQYEKPSSYFVREYLNGKYGGWRDVGPYICSLFYALDRFDVRPMMLKALADGKILISNRYMPSSMGHQGAKIKSRRERLAFFKWLHTLEYGILDIPRPDVTIVLHVPARMAQRLIARKGSREYVHGVKRDIHEADLQHVQLAEQTYLEMVKTFPQEFRLIQCVENGNLLTMGEIHEKVWKIVSKHL